MSAPLGSLKVNAAYVRLLAYQQQQVADAVWDARFKPAQVGEYVKKTHGTVCDDTSKALQRAVDERGRATFLTQSQSEDLAVKLEHAAATYEEIDRQAKDTIDGQMRPGG
ncbi:type VII secretion target [Mycobacterium sp. E802]|uniref:type VII secretion target n=1 Tax=Mycobacterium sp. E802 TaxID=1834152 RepID=UPI000A76783F|nr:type VII secretion target [Mycobacterium sp. E802]